MIRMKKNVEIFVVVWTTLWFEIVDGPVELQTETNEWRLGTNR